jgi:hypothetical protein
MNIIYILKSNAIPVTSRGGLQDCEMLRISHSLDTQLINVGEVVSLKAPTALCSTETFFFLLILISVTGQVSPRA